MGLEHSKPLAELQVDDIAAVVEQLGKHYTEIANAIRENGVDGAFLETLNSTELQETLDDLGVTNRLHRRVLERKLASAVEARRPHMIAWDLQDESEQKPRQGLRRTNTLQSQGSAYTTASMRSSRSHKSFPEKEAEAKKLLEIMTLAAEQQMIEHTALMQKESELRSQIKMVSSSNQAA